MNKKEAIQAMLDGKKVREPKWADDDFFIDYIEYHKDGYFVDEDGDKYFMDDEQDDVWEIYEEPKEEPNEAGYKSGYAQALEDVLHKVQGMDSE